ncbi:zinc finger protein 831 [Rhinoderma darwinii]|uniref:zinc finger protein 831 n=1 Tax=Rhinoderma darwinii TaxID=43563 RepID=UPI003F666A2D
MDASNVSVLSSSLAWPSCTSNAPPSIDSHQSSTTTERKSPQAVVLNGLSLPVVQIAQQEGQQTPFQLASGGTSFAIENANLSVIFTPQPQTILQKTPAQTLTLNILNTLPILSPNSPAGLIGASLGKSKSIGKHICAHCGRDCLKPSVLEKHIRSHTGERPFPCNICGISFKTQSNLYKHRRTQTHVNNAKQSFDSDCGSCHEDKLHVQVGKNTCFDISSGTRDVCMDKNQFIQNKNLENDNLPGNKDDVSTQSSVKAHGDSDHLSQTIDSPGMPNQQRTVMDPKSTASRRHGQLQRQHEACLDKQWDSSPSERKLKKCESTDSGYLSHSDSADLQMFAGSPLHSLSECSIESENMPGFGPGDSEDKTASSQKKNLEERISMLISQNKAVVDNTQLDNVRPRKTALSKQGSIDLPMPYTFKDSFHFDIKSLDANRKKVSICAAKTTFNVSEKNKPLFFHSVPTQISTTIENIILTRSNSLPFVESGRLKDRLTAHSIKSHVSGKQPLNASYGNLLLSNTATACTVDFSSSHPRGLVRQAAVDEMQISNVSDSTTFEEIREKKMVVGDQLPSKSKTSNKKGGQRKVNMFSHEKWQMYGDETFKKFYQKNKKNEQVKKTKQETPESKGPISNEICLPPACETGKLSENLVSIPMVSPSTLSLQFTCTSTMTSVSKGMDAPISIRNHQNCLGLSLDNDGSGQGNQPEAKFRSNLNKPKVEIDCSLNVLANVSAPSVFVSDNISIAGPEHQQKAPSISSMHDCLEAFYTDSFQNHERSPSDRKKLKVAELEGEVLYSVSLDIPEDPVEHQNKNVDPITDIVNTSRTLGGDGANTILSCHSLSTILSKNVLLSHGEYSGQIPAQSKQLFIPTTQPSSTSKETLFSPRYLIKFNFTGTSVEEPGAQSNQPKVSGISSKDTDVLDITEDTNARSLLVPTKLCHQTLLENQLKLTQKHDSVIAPFGKISLNEECVPTCCSSKISQHLVQNKSLDTQGSQYQKVRLDDMCRERRHTLEDHREVGVTYNTLYYKPALHCSDNTMQSENNDLMSKQIDLKSSIALVSSDTMSTNDITKPSQDPLFLDIFQPGQTDWKATGCQNQENSLLSTKDSQSGICTVRVTQVTFSTMSTEPKSTWCWLDRCLPLPAEQKEKSYSVYASLSNNAFKDRIPEPHARRIEKDMKDRTTIHGKPVMSSLLMSAKQKDCLEEVKETDNDNFHPLVKRSSKMGTVMKSRHVKRSKDGTRGRSHSKVSQHRTPEALVQDQQYNNINCLSTLESGEVLLTTANFELSDKEGCRTSVHHPTSQPGDLGRESECEATPDNQMNEGTISTPTLALEQLVSGEDHQNSQPTEETAHLEPPQSAPLVWQKSCSNILLHSLPTGNEENLVNQVQLHQDLRSPPPQKHIRKILHRSKTIGHSLGDDAVGSTSRLTCLDSKSRVPVESRDEIRRSSLQNINTPDTYMAPNSSRSGSTLGPRTLTLSRKLQSENHGEPPILKHKSLKTQKKINLELIRKQTHVEYSDSSSDDEGRLYIEILE